MKYESGQNIEKLQRTGGWLKSARKSQQSETKGNQMDASN